MPYLKKTDRVGVLGPSAEAMLLKGKKQLLANRSVAYIKINHNVFDLTQQLPIKYLRPY